MTLKSKLTDSMPIESLATFWERYSFEKMPETTRYCGWKGKHRTWMSIVGQTFRPNSQIILGCDWGRSPGSVFAACPIVQTAAIMLLDATREPESFLLAFDFAGDFLATAPDSWVVSAKFVRDWYQAEIAELRDDVDAVYVVEEAA